MKNKFTKILGLGIVLAAYSTGVNAQANATATAAANIITPISIVKTVDMNFGNVAVSAISSGTVILTTTGSRSATGGVTLPTVAGTVTAAAFTVSGDVSRTYTVTLPTTVNLNNGSALMTATDFTSDPGTGIGAGALSGTGTQTLSVGATLNVANAQTVGAYLSTTPFTVTVNYN